MVLEKTESLCPVCLTRVEAELFGEQDGVYLAKTCPDHGRYKTIVWRGTAESYSVWGKYSADGGGPERVLTQVREGCPHDCGPCSAHTGGVCVALIEVTSRCNVTCPICFANSHQRSDVDPDLRTLERRYRNILACCGPAPVQLSGGEPTVRDDLPEIVRLGRDLGFEMIQIDTNGVRLAEDREYLRKLKDNGTKVLYLQFDGVTDDAYVAIRGTPLVSVKTRVLENCSEAGLGVVLVPTLIPGVNDGQIGGIIRFAKQWMPVVRGVHFQPVSYFGRYPQSPENKDRMTLPEVLRALELQTGGEVRATDFKPRLSKDAHCAFAGFFVVGDDGVLLSAFSPSAKKKTSRPAVAVRSFLETYWSPVSSGCSCQPCSCTSEPQGSISDDLLHWVQEHSLTISGMPFQDAWNIDLRRLTGCCIHVVTDDCLIPFCAYYLTSMGGKRLYGS
jgi:7,8-dihydro-6-hydroxymethylpterin dimethyltransferase